MRQVDDRARCFPPPLIFCRLNYRIHFYKPTPQKEAADKKKAIIILLLCYHYVYDYTKLHHGRAIIRVDAVNVTFCR